MRFEAHTLTVIYLARETLQEMGLGGTVDMRISYCQIMVKLVLTSLVLCMMLLYPGVGFFTGAP
jgi:hypothetical protein